MDYYYSSAEFDGSAHERQFLELLSELEPDERSASFGSLEEAIHAFEQEFGNGG
jgi:hypothetical protein